MLRRYRVETRTRDGATWKTVYYTDSLPVAKQYAASLRKQGKTQATRVMDQRVEEVVSYDPT